MPQTFRTRGRQFTHVLLDDRIIATGDGAGAAVQGEGIVFRGDGKAPAVGRLPSLPVRSVRRQTLVLHAIAPRARAHDEHLHVADCSLGKRAFAIAQVIPPQPYE